MRTGLDVPALKRIAAARGDRTCYAIAKRAGVSQQTVKRLLDGIAEPSMRTLCRLATAYAVSVADLLTDSAAMSDAA